MTDKIILISVDSLRYDCINYLNNHKALKEFALENELKTPTLDSIARKSICFTNAISTNPYTTASHASIITGLYPPRHGVRSLYDTKLSKNVFTMAEILKNQGYITILSTDIMELWKPLGLHKGFSNIFERDDKGLFSFLEKHQDDKIFLFVHFFDIHTPYLFSEYSIYKGYNDDYYELLKELDKEFKIGLNYSKDTPHVDWKKISDKLLNKKDIFFPIYIKGIVKFDNGRFKNFIKEIDSLGYLDNSLIFIFADHGEGRCYENKEFFHHGGWVYEDVIKVPMLVYNPTDTKIGKIVDTHVSMTDIFPTVLEIVTKMTDYKTDGISLIPLIKDKNIIEDDRLIYSESWNLDSGLYCGDIGEGIPHIIGKKASNSILQQRSLRIKNKKYIIFGKPDIYYDKIILDLPSDDFVEAAYRCILGRIGEKDGVHYWTNLIDNNIKSKNDVIIEFLRSKENQNKSNFVLFDLDIDPEELYQINVLKDPVYNMDSFKFFDEMMRMERCAISTEKIFESNNDQEGAIKKKLKALGYF